MFWVHGMCILHSTTMLSNEALPSWGNATSRYNTPAGQGAKITFTDGSVTKFTRLERPHLCSSPTRWWATRSFSLTAPSTATPRIPRAQAQTETHATRSSSRLPRNEREHEQSDADGRREHSSPSRVEILKYMIKLGRVKLIESRFSQE